ncbi:hypothetical protein ABKV19_022404 [Rosa sericea]
MTITVAPTSESAEDKKRMGKRRKVRGKYNLVDRISALPDDILVSIVSFLEIKEAAATSILSRRWQNVWKYTMTLNLERTDFFAGDAFRCFKSLMQKLRVGVTGEVLEHFLSNCPALERLSVYAAKSLVSLRVVGPSMALKYLVIKECPELKGIEICEANVVSFAYKGRKIDLLLRNVPLLVEVDIVKRERHNDFMGLALNPLSICLPQIKILKLDMCGLVNNENYAFPILENLEHLELFVHPDYDLGLRHLTSFMDASPYMQRLVLKSPPYCIYRGRAEKAVECPHRYLKVVELNSRFSRP